ncbi:bifunctional metallophosphatase/5'-nucleotidase [Myxococcus xanthus]|uniref:bifunctional metallophosphatase/5'-nucleotidase n=1 Tax=Myxococcus xanthus TaxID=34 RepID=UPI001CEC7EF3|nr:5'-nucleotidase C-terminal domain-containing protein [Myxococcus xanthus]
MRLKTEMEVRRGARSSSRTRWLTVTWMAASVLSACGDDDAVDPGEQPAPLDLTILHINDHHSHLAGSSLELNVTNAAGDTVAAEVESSGFARVTSAMKELAAGKENVLKLHAGDALTGTLYFNRAGQIGEADAAMMNTVCFDAFTLGNHEFDKGDTELKSFIDRLHAGPCQTPVISANVQFGAGSALHTSRAAGYVEPFTVVERGGQKIGLVGLTIAGKTKESSSPDADTTFEAEVPAAQRAIDALRAQGINKIIVMSHIGYQLDRTIIPQLSGVDAVIGGDSHTLLGPAAMETFNVGTPAGPYAESLRNRDGETVCLGQAWQYSQVVGEMTLRFDAEGVVTSCGGTPHVLIGNQFSIDGTPVSESDNAAMLASVAVSGFLRVTQPDAAAAQVLAPFQGRVDEYSRTVVATADDELCNRRVPGNTEPGRSSVSCNALGEVHSRGGDIQQLVAQAYLEVANADYGGADITLQSAGGVRRPLQGPVTAADVIEVLPFGNMLFRLDVTGAEVKPMIEDGLHATFREGGTTGPYPYTGGLRFDVNAAQARGQRASNLEVLDQTTGQWNELQPTATYRLFVLSFNATGGDGYVTLANVPAERRSDIGVLDADVLQTYIDRQAEREPGTNLPVLHKVDASLYSTKSFVE